MLMWHDLSIFPDMLNLFPGGWEIAMPPIARSVALVAPLKNLTQMLPVSFEVVALSVFAAALEALLIPSGSTEPDTGRA